MAQLAKNSEMHFYVHLKIIAKDPKILKGFFSPKSLTKHK